MTESARSLSGRTVLDLSTATSVGVVASTVIDPSTGTISHLVLAKTSGAGTVLPWTSIAAVGPDAVTVTDGTAVEAPARDHEARIATGDLDPLGKPVLTDQGARIGRLDDVALDPGSGTVLALVVDGAARDDLTVRGSGGHAVVVTTR